MKKPSLAVIIASGKSGKSGKGKEPSTDDDEDYDEGGDFAASADDLADMLGVGDDDKSAFRDALEACIRSCK